MFSVFVYGDCILCLQSFHGDPNLKSAGAKKVCGGGASAKGKDRKTSRTWNSYTDQDRDGQH